MKTIYPNDDKTKNAFVKQERGETEPVSGLCRARRKKAEGQLTNEARAETGLVRDYALQGVRRRSQDKTHTISKT